MTVLSIWAQRWGIPAAALAELEALVGIDDPRVTAGTMVAEPGISEAAVTSRVRLAAARVGIHLWRNQNGAFYDERGQFIRFGLANESEKQSKLVKSSDFIGLRRTLITPAMVGAYVGIFTAREIKHSDWVYTGTGREPAQLNFINLVNCNGGDARFSTGREYSEGFT
jgi:hypothetical protein